MVFILMLIAAAGMVFGAIKMKQGMEWGKGLTIGCAIVALVLAGVHIKKGVSGNQLSKSEITKLQEREAAYQRISAEKLAQFLATKVTDGKAVIIRNADYGIEAPDINQKIQGLKNGFGDGVEVLDVIAPEIPESIKAEIEKMKEAYAGEVPEGEDISPEAFMGMGYGEMMEASQFNKLTRTIAKECNLVVMLIDFPYDLNQMTLFTKKPRPAVAGVINMPQPMMKAAIRDGYITAVVLTKPDGDFKSRDVPKDLDEAFDRRFILVHAGNVDQIADTYKGMFPDE